MAGAKDTEEIRTFLALSLPEKVPVGFRFRPTDSELAGYYLRRKIDGRLRPIDLFMMPVVDNAYHTDPQDLCGKSNFQSNDDGVWYFFSPNVRNYLGSRNYNKRSTDSGNWRITGAQLNITESPGSEVILAKKRTLVFREKGGNRTVWTIHEFTTPDDKDEFVLCRLIKKPPETLLKDEFVLCRLIKKPPETLLKERNRRGIACTFGESLQYTSSMPLVGIITDESREQVGYADCNYLKLEAPLGRLCPDDYKMQEEPIQDNWIKVDPDPSTSVMMNCSYNGSFQGISQADHINEENTEPVVTEEEPNEPLISTEAKFLDGAGTQKRTPQHFLSSEDSAGYQDLVIKRSRIQKFICDRSTTKSEKYVTTLSGNIYRSRITEVGEYDNNQLIHGGRTPYDATAGSSCLEEPKKNDYLDSICCSEAVQQPNTLLTLRRRTPKSGEHRFLAAQVAPAATDFKFTAENLAILLAILLFIAVLMIWYLAYSVRH